MYHLVYMSIKDSLVGVPSFCTKLLRHDFLFNIEQSGNKVKTTCCKYTGTYLRINIHKSRISETTAATGSMQKLF